MTTKASPHEVPARPVACKLTGPEFKERMITVIGSLKKQVLGRTELDNGYQFKFNGTDPMVDELVDFIKTERLCCEFFDFGLTVSGDGSLALLSITGPDGAKHFIKSELGL